MDRMNLLVLIDQLEAMVERAPEVPLVGKVLIDGDELYDLVDIIRAAIPEDVRKAQTASSEKDRMLAEGQEQAEQMITKAEEYAIKLVSQSEIYRQAEEESRIILDEAKQKAQEIEKEALQFADQIFTNLHDGLNKTLTIVEKSKEELGKVD